VEGTHAHAAPHILIKTCW